MPGRCGASAIDGALAMWEDTFVQAAMRVSAMLAMSRGVSLLGAYALPRTTRAQAAADGLSSAEQAAAGLVAVGSASAICPAHQKRPRRQIAGSPHQQVGGASAALGVRCGVGCWRGHLRPRRENSGSNGTEACHCSPIRAPARLDKRLAGGSGPGDTARALLDTSEVPLRIR
eukprot:scaffold5059_cov120-Isochrysis_galbana.AAC.4